MSSKFSQRSLSVRKFFGTPPEGYAAWYGAVSTWWRKRAFRVRMLRMTDKVLKYLCYVLYPVLLVLVVACDVRAARTIWSAGYISVLPDILRYVAVPAAGFFLTTWLRRTLDEPRPYEACAIEQLIPKQTHGKSFPSRHTYSVFVIALCWLHRFLLLGIFLLVCSVVMAYVRVIGGVHYPRDVIAGGLLGICCGLLCWL